MIRVIIFLILTTVATACGSSADQAQNLPLQGSSSEQGPRGASCTANDEADGVLIECEDGRTAKVRHGKDGEDGEDGINGTNGTDGADGIDGNDGADGEDGIDAHTLELVDMNGNSVGHVYYLDGSTNDYWVAGANKMRFEIDSTDGTFPYAYLLYSGLNCTGTKRMLIPNGKFANVYLDARDNTLVKAVGANLGNFNYQSRVTQSNSCSNSTGTALVSYETEVPTLPFAYPLGRVYIAN